MLVHAMPCWQLQCLPESLIWQLESGNGELIPTYVPSLEKTWFWPGVVWRWQQLVDPQPQD